MRDRLSRRLASYFLVALLTGVSAVAARRHRKPFNPDAPEFRRRGPAQAKLNIVEFSDFQCPACRYAEAPLKQVFTVYGDNLRFTFKHFPLRMHQWARNGAVAAECAGRQGKFWPYHDRLYDRQDEWTNEKADDFLLSYAMAEHLDLNQWKTCVADPATASAVSADVKDGENAWVGSTPTFFVNGRRFVGGKQLAELGTLFMDRELKK